MNTTFAGSRGGYWLHNLAMLMQIGVKWRLAHYCVIILLGVRRRRFIAIDWVNNLHAFIFDFNVMSWAHAVFVDISAACIRRGRLGAALTTLIRHFLFGTVVLTDLFRFYTFISLLTLSNRAPRVVCQTHLISHHMFLFLWTKTVVDKRMYTCGRRPQVKL